MATAGKENRTRWRILGYIAWFHIVFFLMLYWTFPVKTFQGQAQQYLQNILSRAVGKQVKVNIGSMSLWRLSGLQLSNVFVHIPSTDGKTTVKVDLNHMRARLVILQSLMGSKTLFWQMRLQEQSFSGNASIDDRGGISFFSLNVPRVQLEKLTSFTAVTGLSVRGDLQLEAYLDVGNGYKDLKGSFDLSWKKAGIGPGNLVIPSSMGLGNAIQIPVVQLGTVVAQARADQGKAEMQKLRLTGGDLQIQAKGESRLRKNWKRTSLSGKGWFRLGNDFLKKNPGLKAFLGMSSELRRAKDSQGRYGFSLKGMIGRPRFSFRKD